MNNKNKNTIDAVIPVYNGEKFILQAIQSATEQTLSPLKIIVVDDGSTDSTNKIVSQYAETSKIEIKIIKKENGGLSSARNAGIKESDSEFIAFLDADDVWYKNKLEQQMKVFKNTDFKNLALVYCDYDVIDNNGNVKYKNYKSPLNKKTMRGMVFDSLIERNKITSSGSGVLIKREIFDKVGLFDENLKFGEDWDMWLRISEKYEVDFSENTLVHIRKHDTNMTVNSAKTFKNELDFYKKWLLILDNKYPIPYFWADKITFRILSNIFKNNLIKVLNMTLSKELYRKIFRQSLGSFYLYLPLFFIRQILSIFLSQQYLKIFLGLIKHKAR